MNPILFIIFSGILLSGCASSSGSHNLLTNNFNPETIAKYQDLQVNVSTKADAVGKKLDEKLMTDKIIADIKADSPSRFKAINATPPAAQTLLASVEVKNYEEGNAFARAMLAGLGQIHIDADVILSDLTTKEKLAEYEVTKTFAWGGVVGASTSITDVEVGFSKSVANSILNKE